jgi:NitT/TauT family transport system substrate-binding protein
VTPLSLILVSVLGCSEGPSEAPASPPQPEPQALKLGLAIPSYVHAVGWIAEGKGFFDDQGLDAEIFVMKGSSASMTGLLSGELDLVLAGGDAAIKATVAGGDLVILAGLVNKHYHQLIGRGEVNAPEKLKGHVIGLPFYGGPQDMAVKFALARFGLGYGTDVDVRAMGAEYARLTALTQGDVDAVTAAAPPSMIAELGFTVIGDLPSWDLAFPYMQLVTRRSTLTEKPDLVAGALHALCDAMVSYRDDKAGSLAILGPQLGAKKGPPDEAYTTMGPGRLSFPPDVNEAALQEVIGFLAEDDERYVGKKAAEFVDGSVLAALKKQGACGG